MHRRRNVFSICEQTFRRLYFIVPARILSVIYDATVCPKSESLQTGSKISGLRYSAQQRGSGKRKRGESRKRRCTFPASAAFLRMFYVEHTLKPDLKEALI